MSFSFLLFFFCSYCYVDFFYIIGLFALLSQILSYSATCQKKNIAHHDIHIHFSILVNSFINFFFV